MQEKIVTKSAMEKCYNKAKSSYHKWDEAMVLADAFDQSRRLTWPYDIEAIEWIYEQARLADLSPTTIAPGGPWACRIALLRRIFDLSLVPKMHGAGLSAPQLKHYYASTSERVKHIARRQPFTYLSPISTDGGKDGSPPQLLDFDKFALRIADNSDADGIYAVCGMRGSGKTTLLNHIEAFCNNPLEYKIPPLVVRFDLGPLADDKAIEKFSLDLVREIGRRAADQIRPPLLRSKELRHVPSLGARGAMFWKWRAFFGHIGDWCQYNSVWAFIVAVASCGYWVWIPQVPQGPQGQQATQGPQDFPAAQIIAVLAVGVIVVGLGHRIGVRIRSELIRRRGPHSTSRHFLAWPAIVIAVLLSSAGVGIISGWPNISKALATVFTTGSPAETSTDRWITRVRDNLGTLSSIAALTLFCLTLGVPPLWWEAYLRLDALRRASADGGRRLDIQQSASAFGAVGAILKMLLPNTDNPDRLESLSIPFLQDRLKVALRHAVTIFGGVVVLIDDADAIAAGKGDEPEDARLATLMCLLRPLSKVHGVRAVVAVPLQYCDFRARYLGDFHSSCRDVRVLGDPRLFTLEHMQSRVDGKFGKKEWCTTLLAQFGQDMKTTAPSPAQDNDLVVRCKIVIYETIESRMAVKLSTIATGNGTSPIRQTSAWEDITEIWNLWFDTSDNAAKNIRRALSVIGSSRRELLREIDRVLEANADDLKTLPANADWRPFGLHRSPPKETKPKDDAKKGASAAEIEALPGYRQISPPASN